MEKFLINWPIAIQLWIYNLFSLLVCSVFKVRMSKFFFQLVIVFHVFGCSWCFVACPLNECSDEHNWVKEQGRYPCGVRWDTTTTNVSIPFEMKNTLFKHSNLITSSPFSGAKYLSSKYFIFSSDSIYYTVNFCEKTKSIWIKCNFL